VSVTTGGETTGHGNISILFTNRNRVTPIICLLYRNIDISVGKFVYPKPRFESGDGGWYELTKDIGEIGSLGDINYMFMCYGEPTDFTGYTIRAGPFTPLSDGPIVNVSALSLDGSLNILNFEVDSYLTVTNPAISGVTYLNAGTLLSLKPSWADIVPSIYYGNYSYAVGDYPVSLSYTGNIWTENTWRIRLYHGNITHPTSLIYLKQTTCTYVPYTLQSGDY